MHGIKYLFYQTCIFTVIVSLHYWRQHLTENIKTCQYIKIVNLIAMLSIRWRPLVTDFSSVCRCLHRASLDTCLPWHTTGGISSRRWMHRTHCGRTEWRCSLAALVQQAIRDHYRWAEIRPEMVFRCYPMLPCLVAASYRQGALRDTRPAGPTRPHSRRNAAVARIPR